MSDCDVCLHPVYDPTTVTFSHPDVPDCPVEFCRDCVAALLQFMTDRWHQAIDDNNAAVAELKRWLGLDEKNAGALTAEPPAPAATTVIPSQQESAPAGDTAVVRPVAEQTGQPAPTPATDEGEEP